MSATKANRSPPMKCLNCGTEMTTNQVVTKKDSISYDMCDKCGSLWLEAGDLDRMAFNTTGSSEYCEEIGTDESEKKPKKWPRCDDFNLSKVKFLESDDIQIGRASCRERVWFLV